MWAVRRTTKIDSPYRSSFGRWWARAASSTARSWSENSCWISASISASGSWRPTQTNRPGRLRPAPMPGHRRRADSQPHERGELDEQTQRVEPDVQDDQLLEGEHREGGVERRRDDDRGPRRAEARIDGAEPSGHRVVARQDVREPRV